MTANNSPHSNPRGWNGRKRMRVLAISRAYGEHAGGMERLSFELLHHLNRRDDIELTTIVNTTGAGTSIAQARLRSIIFALTSIPRALASARRADVIHIGDPVLALAGWLIKRLYRKPIAVTIHGLDLTYSNPLYQLYLRWFFRTFDAYIPISSHAAAALKRHRVTGRVHVIHPGITDRFYNPNIQRRELEKLIKRPLNDHRTLLTTGRLIPRKGHAWFIKNVLPHLPADTLYIIAGDGPARTALEKLAQTNDQITVLGRVSDDDLKILYNTVDAFIQPNIPIPGEAEGFGLVLLEAALCQRPVFASNLEGISDAVTDDKNGNLLPANNPEAWIQTLTNFLENPQSNPSAREYTLKRFSWQQKANEYQAVLINIPAA